MKAALLFAVWSATIPLFGNQPEECDPAPAIVLPATSPAGDRFAVMLSGDGGWRPIDRGVTNTLRANGIPVVGFITSTYFRKLRTPEESACALEQIIRTYQQLWKKKKVILVGFSRGADVLPFMINRLSPDVRASIESIALLGVESWIDFRYNPPWTLAHYFRHEAQFAVMPEIDKLRGENVLCVYGEREKDSLCRNLDPSQFKIVGKHGGHHFAGRYDEVGKAILNAAP